jgi:hypothetical protein
MRTRDLILPEVPGFPHPLFFEMTDTIAQAAATLNEITHELPGGSKKSPQGTAARASQRQDNPEDLRAA